MNGKSIIIIGAGIGGLTSAALLAQQGYKVTVLEAHTYPGGCAGTFYHKGYRFDAGATVAGGFQAGGPHQLVADMLDIQWPIHSSEPAWIVRMPQYEIHLTRDNQDVLRNFPQSAAFWEAQHRMAEIGWRIAGLGMPWPPSNLSEAARLARIGITHLPDMLRLLPLVFSSTYGWLKRFNLHHDTAFVRFIDAQLLISAQATAQSTNAAYSSTALDLPRQGVYHVSGGMGGLAETLVNRVNALGGQVNYRHRVTAIEVEGGRVKGVRVQIGRHNKEQTVIPCDVLIANLPPASIKELLGKPASTKKVEGWGAFALHIAVKDHPQWHATDHYQLIADINAPLGETNSIFVSLSPLWDKSRAPEGYRAVTVTTHTHVDAWWDLLNKDKAAYGQRKDQYMHRMIDLIDQHLTGFKDNIEFTLSGTPITYQYYTSRFQGMVGGFPQTSLFTIPTPKLGISNLWMVGDSIFPGQSTAGVTLGAMRVVKDIETHFDPL